MLKKSMFSLSLAVAASTMLSTAAMAQEEAPISAELVLEWQNEYRSKSDDASIDETNNSFVRAELAPTIRLNDQFFIDGVLVFEPFDQAASLNAFDDIWFDRNGAFAEELKLNFESGPWAAWVGKFNPGFGTAWDFGRGIWSEDFAEDYEITEKLGVGVAYTQELEDGSSHTLTATSFWADTSFLSGSTITHRPKMKLTDGGASNTEDFSSFTVSLDGENLGGVENLGYHLGYRSLGEQDNGANASTDSETGFAATVNYVIPVDDNLSLDVLAEYVRLRGFEGVRDSDRDYYTASVVATIDEAWNVTAGYTRRDIKNDGSGVSYDDTLLQLTGGYDFGNGLTAEAGWRSSEEASSDTDILGFLFRYTMEF